MTDSRFVDEQLLAFNRHDVDGFLACYSDDAVLSSLTGGPIATGMAEWRAYYVAMFDREPTIRAELLHRTIVNGIVADLEMIHADCVEPRQSLVLYKVADDARIGAVWFAR